MTTTIDPMAAVKLLREALEGLRNGLDLAYSEDKINATTIDEALRLTASVETPVDAGWADYLLVPLCPRRPAPVDEQLTSEAVAARIHRSKSGEVRVFLNDAGRNLPDDAPLYAAPPATPPAKEAILQAMVDQAQELGLYDDAPINSVPAQTGTSSAPVDERAALIREALDIAFDLVNEEAHRIHETYKGYKPHKHAAIDADVATITAARAALQQPGQDDILSHIRTAIEIYYKRLDKHENGNVAQNRAFESIQSAMGMSWGDWIAAQSPKEKP